MNKEQLQSLNREQQLRSLIGGTELKLIKIQNSIAYYEADPLILGKRTEVSIILNKAPSDEEFEYITTLLFQRPVAFYETNDFCQITY